MVKIISGFSGFSVRDADEARDFYSEILRLEVISHGYGSSIRLPDGASVFFYPKGADHMPATFTILNFRVDDIDEAVDELIEHGITFEQYEHTDEKGIQRGIANNMGPDQAWFKDPSQNIVSILKEAPSLI